MYKFPLAPMGRGAKSIRTCELGMEVEVGKGKGKGKMIDLVSETSQQKDRNLPIMDKINLYYQEHDGEKRKVLDVAYETFQQIDSNSTITSS